MWLRVNFKSADGGRWSGQDETEKKEPSKIAKNHTSSRGHWPVATAAAAENVLWCAFVSVILLIIVTKTREAARSSITATSYSISDVHPQRFRPRNKVCGCGWGGRSIILYSRDDDLSRDLSRWVRSKQGTVAVAVRGAVFMLRWRGPGAARL